ncbi:hypothetical protein ACU686_35525 [Yinghuangia aomiensis]
MRNPILRRRKYAAASDFGLEMGYYNADEHSLSLLNLAFAEPKGYTRSGADAYPYCHYVILHEVGHVIEEWYKPQRAPTGREDRIRRQIGEMNAERRELEALRSGLKAGADFENAGLALEELSEKIRAVKRERTAAERERYGQDDCLGIFIAYVNGAGVEPFTDYASDNWPDEPSPKLLAWFRHGGYRLGRPEAPPHEAGLNAEQITLLTDVRGLLEGLCLDLAKTASASEKGIAGLRESYLKLMKALGSAEGRPRQRGRRHRNFGALDHPIRARPERRNAVGPGRQSAARLRSCFPCRSWSARPSVPCSPRAEARTGGNRGTSQGNSPAHLHDPAERQWAGYGADRGGEPDRLRDRGTGQGAGAAPRARFPPVDTAPPRGFGPHPRDVAVERGAQGARRLRVAARAGREPHDAGAVRKHGVLRCTSRSP